MATQSPRPQSIGGVLDAAFELYRSTVAKTWALSLGVAASSAITSVYSIYDVVAHPDAPEKEFYEALLEPGYIASSIATMVLVNLFSAAIYVQQDSIARGAPMGSGAAFFAALRRLPRLTLALVLWTLILVITAVTIVPPLIFALSLLLYIPVAMFDDRGALQSLIGSHRLVWGHWWRTGAIVKVGFFVVLTLYVAAALIAELASLAFTSADFGNELRAQIAALVASVAASIIVTPFFTAVLLCTYWDLKLRKQGTDLVARVDALSPA